MNAFILEDGLGMGLRFKAPVTFSRSRYGRDPGKYHQ
jgi:hypothetical protein